MWVLCVCFILVNIHLLRCSAYNFFIMVLLYNGWLSRHWGPHLGAHLIRTMLGLCSAWHQDVINRKLLKGRFLSGVWGGCIPRINGNQWSLYLLPSSWRLSLERIISTKRKVWILETASAFKWWWAGGCCFWVFLGGCSLESCSFLLIICYSCRRRLLFSTRLSDFILAKTCLLLVIRISRSVILVVFGQTQRRDFSRRLVAHTSTSLCLAATALLCRSGTKGLPDLCRSSWPAPA